MIAFLTALLIAFSIVLVLFAIESALSKKQKPTYELRIFVGDIGSSVWYRSKDRKALKKKAARCLRIGVTCDGRSSDEEVFYPASLISKIVLGKVKVK